jgi:glycine oxidase
VPENWNEKKEFQLDSLLMAEAFWAEVRDAASLDPGHARLGRLQPLADAGAVAQAGSRADSAAKLWRGQARWQVETGADAWRGTSPTGLWVRDTLSARLHPRMACRALAQAIRARGGTIMENTEFAEENPGQTVVWATGARGLLDLSAALGRPVGTGVKGQAAAFACDARDQPQLYVDGLHIVPHADGTVAVGSTSEREWTDPAATDNLLETLILRARAACPMLARAPVTQRWAGLRPRAASRAPVLGRWPGRPGHFIANGGFKIGFGMAPKVAEVMADLILDGRDRIPPGFRVEDCL